MSFLKKSLALMCVLFLAKPVFAIEEDGYDLWLRYRPLDSHSGSKLAQHAQAIVYAAEPSQTVNAAVAELRRGVGGMSGRTPATVRKLRDGALVLATPASMPALKDLNLPMVELGTEGYLLRGVRLQGHRVTLIAANSDVGLLYGAFAWLRLARTGADLATLTTQSTPKVKLRMLNHWDNLDRTVERGYAGESIWDWWSLPDIRDPRYVDYARANASLGINGTVLTNVNSKAEVLTPAWIAKTAAVADILRPYGIKVYLTARFSAPLELKEASTADPLDPAVAAWWKSKANEIYKAIPDFGGFLVKANSEGQPGPQDYGRNHADGANMLARAVAPHNGVVLWRAFVYSPESREDRAKQAFNEFKPLDGRFDSNVVIQVKNGAIDFQPREPFHPLFGAMPKTALGLELQITKEYLGFATHLAYLGTMYEELLKADTRLRDVGPTVAEIVDGSFHHTSSTAMAGVANIGSSRMWSGSHFDQANWYVFGRMAWDPRATARDVAREWVAQTFSAKPVVVDAVTEMMMTSREAVVNYMTPLGLHHLMDTGHHYGPGPWVDNLQRADWNPVYYHKADRNGVGFDRGPGGSNAVAQYAPAWSRVFSDPHTTPDEYLLWFHHLPWDYSMRSGKTLWQEVIAHYDAGVLSVADSQARWVKLKPSIDPLRHADVAARLAVQLREAQWWRDACIAYFQSVSGLPLPNGVRPPPLTLDQYKARRFSFAPGRG